ncbi:MAG: hypothetical protein EP346_02490 [Bacteroidetes bacterium]|nr:MAG: hypothetical protein EP346_02490 [Bacteroidota bacterium]
MNYIRILIMMVLGFVGVLDISAQTQNYEELRKVPPLKSLYILPYGGFATHFVFSNDNEVSPSSGSTPTNVPNWSEQVDNENLLSQPSNQKVSPGGMLGLEIGQVWEYDDSATFGRFYIGIAYEYQSRAYSAVQQYNNGSVVGQYSLEGKEVKSIVRLQMSSAFRKVGINFGIWYRLSDVSDRTYTFNSYRNGNLEYSQVLHPTPMTEGSDRWRDSRGGMGFSIGVNYEPWKYLRLFGRFEYSVIPTNTRENLSFEPVFPDAGIATYSLHLGVGVPIVFN